MSLLVEMEVKALVSVAVRIEQTAKPVIIQNTPNSLAQRDFGTRSPYLKNTLADVIIFSCKIIVKYIWLKV